MKCVFWMCVKYKNILGNFFLPDSVCFVSCNWPESRSQRSQKLTLKHACDIYFTLVIVYWLKSSYLLLRTLMVVIAKNKYASYDVFCFPFWYIEGIAQCNIATCQLIDIFVFVYLNLKNHILAWIELIAYY